MMSTPGLRERIRAEVSAIEPLDALEREHLGDALAWIDSGAELCRARKPATPPKHLVSYFAVVDVDRILLVDHRNAGLWLPAGGHVEAREHPRRTVERELQEELGFETPHPIGSPLMITCRTTIGLDAGHIDVSLWYVVCASRDQVLNVAIDEFNAVGWFGFSEIPFDRSDPNLSRFIKKLTAQRAG
jgi:ADP-ribose pyrophosphatase YjhB (NUDIX family)